MIDKVRLQWQAKRSKRIAVIATGVAIVMSGLVMSAEESAQSLTTPTSSSGGTSLVFQPVVSGNFPDPICGSSPRYLRSTGCVQDRSVASHSALDFVAVDGTSSSRLRVDCTSSPSPHWQAPWEGVDRITVDESRGRILWENSFEPGIAAVDSDGTDCQLIGQGGYYGSKRIAIESGSSHLYSTRYTNLRRFDALAPASPAGATGTALTLTGLGTFAFNQVNDLHVSEGTLYMAVSETSTSLGAILAVTLDSTATAQAARVLISGETAVTNVSVDPVSDQVFWATGTEVRRASSVDGSSPTTIRSGSFDYVVVIPSATQLAIGALNTAGITVTDQAGTTIRTLSGTPRTIPQPISTPSVSSTLSWDPTTALASTDSPVVFSAAVAAAGTVSYAVQSAGPTGCTVDSATRTLTFTSSGSCVVDAEFTSSGGVTGARLRRTFAISGAGIYATCWSPDDLIVIDDAAPTVVKSTISNGSGSGHFNAVAVNPAGTRAYKTNTASNTVSVIDTSSDTLLRNVTVMSEPRMVEVSPDGLHYYVGNNSGTIYKMRASDDQRVLTISAGGLALGAAFTPDGAFMYLPHSSNAIIRKVDTSTGEVVDTAAAGAGVRWVAASDRHVVSTNYDANTVTIIDAATFEPLATIASGNDPSGVTIDRAGAKAYVAVERSNAVQVFDIATQTLERTVGVGSRTWDVALNPAGTRLYVGSYQGGGLRSIDLGTWTVRGTGGNCLSLGVAAPAVQYPYLNSPTALAATMTSTTADLTWSVPAASGWAVESYTIEWSDDGFVTSTSATTQTTNHSVAGLTPGTLHEFRVRAENATSSIQSIWSARLSASTSGATSTTTTTSTTSTTTTVPPVTSSTTSTTVPPVTSSTSTVAPATTTAPVTVAVPAGEVFVPQSQVAAPVTTVAAVVPATTVAAPVTTVAAVVPATTVVSVTSTTVAPAVRSVAADDAVVSSAVPSTTVVPAVTSTTLAPVVVPDAPLAALGAAGVVVDGEVVEAVLSRSENRLVLTAADVSTTVFGETADGVRIPLDESGALRLESGDVIVVEGAGFEPGAAVEVWMMSTPTLLGELTADRSGVVSGRFVPPVTLEPGEHRLVLSGAAAGEVPVVLAFGVFVGSEVTALWSGIPLWIPVSIAIGLALIVPTRYSRRRRAVTDGAD